MSKKKSGCGRLVLLVLAIIVVVAIMMSKQESPRTSSPQSTAPAPTKPVPKITAGLSKFTVDRANAQFVFTLEVSNQESKENAIRVVVYGRNDMFSPPRRSAWPAAGLLFHQAGTRRGALSSSDVSRNWSSRPDNTKGIKISLKPNGSKSLEGALPINDTCPHDDWLGKQLDPRSMYNEVSLWVFSQNGQLIFDKKYDVK